jgi:hypothetical protein
VNADAKMVLSGIGGLIFAYLVIANYKNFNAITNSIAQDSSTLISTLQGRGGGQNLAATTTV